MSITNSNIQIGVKMLGCYKSSAGSPEVESEPANTDLKFDSGGHKSATEEVIVHEPPNPRLTPFWTNVIIVLTIIGTLIAMNQVFFWQAFGITVPTNSFLYLIAGSFISIVFIVYPIKKLSRRESVEESLHPEDSHLNDAKPGVPLYDVFIICFFIVTTIFFAWNGANISTYGWSMVAPPIATFFSLIFWAVIAESLRRTAGWIVALLAVVASIYPLFADVIPLGFMQGISYDFFTLAQIHAMGIDSIIGLPFNTAATILVGFLLFGVVLQHTGGADFFNDLSNSIFGQFRGGAAKVSVTSSAAMGMMSGSAVSNVLTTGPMTIPTMIRAGFSPKTAGAVEATASSGGSITPPIMGTAAFLMVSFLGVPYTEILIAATIPAFLYYFGIYMQIDGYAATRKLHGIDRSLLPRTWTTMKSGWPYMLALALLTFMLITTPVEARVPYYAILLLLVIAFLRRDMKFGLKELAELILDAGKTLAQILGIIAGVGLILGGLTATGVALSLSRDLVVLVGGSVILILIAGAIACFVLGMGLTISAAYVFLAIVMVPALTALDVNPIASHLFVIYWASVSYITPPVGLAAFAAAGISKASPMATSIEAMKFGAVKYVIPFAFVLNPALVAQDSVSKVALAAAASVIGVFALSSMFSGYLQFVETPLNWVLRIVLGAGGFLIFLPQWSISLLGLGIIAAVLVVASILNKANVALPEPISSQAPETVQTESLPSELGST